MMDKKTLPRGVRVVAGLIMLLVLGVVYAWSTFKNPLGAVFSGWTQANLSLNFTLSMCFFCIGGFVASLLGKKLSPRVIVAISGVVMCVGFFGASFLPAENPGGALVMLYIFYGVICGLASGLGYNTTLTCVLRWFPDKTGLISGILLFGYGFGSLLFGQLAIILMKTMTVFATFRVFAIVALVVLVAGSFTLAIPRPEQLPAAAAKKAAGSRVDLTPGQALATSSFWLFFVWNLLITAAGLLFINSAANIGDIFIGVASLGLLVSVFNGAGRIIFGKLLDSLGLKKSMFIAFLCLAAAGAALTAASLTQGKVLLYVGMVLTGVAYGSAPTSDAYFIKDYYGPKHYGVTLSISVFMMIPASLIGPLVSGTLQDKAIAAIGTAAARGVYTTTFIMIIVFAVLSLVMALLIKRPKVKAAGTEKK